VLVARDGRDIRRKAFRERPRLDDLVILSRRERGFDRFGSAPADVGIDVPLSQRIGGGLDDGRSACRIERRRRWRRTGRLSCNAYSCDESTKAGNDPQKRRHECVSGFGLRARSTDHVLA
jgi:hypothetical protein